MMFEELKKAARSVSVKYNEPKDSPIASEGFVSEENTGSNGNLIEEGSPDRLSETKASPTLSPSLQSNMNTSVVHIIGAQAHGKSTLLAAMSKVLALPHGSNSSQQGHVEFSANNRLFVCRENQILAGETEATKSDLALADSALLVIAATDGPTIETNASMRALRETGKPFSVFLSKCDVIDDQELIDLVRMETEDLLENFGLSSHIPIIQGSAQNALRSPATDPNAAEYVPIQNVISAIRGDYHDCQKPSTYAQTKNEFVFEIEDSFVVTGRGTVVAGHVVSGSIYMDGEADIILSEGTRIRTVVKAIEMYRKLIDHAETGDAVGLLLRGVRREDILTAKYVVNRDGAI